MPDVGDVLMTVEIINCCIAHSLMYSQDSQGGRRLPSMHLACLEVTGFDGYNADYNSDMHLSTLCQQLTRA